jgi:hypothetical protein
MSRVLSSPGAVLVLLKRGRTSTDVLVFGERSHERPLPCDAATSGTTQWQLAEGLCEQSWANEVSRLYASTITIEHEGEPLTAFVGFLDRDATDAPLPPLAEWVGLRAAATTLAPPWAALVSRVREAFVARSPDEALRVR